jgi:serine/threonine protein kinase
MGQSYRAVVGCTPVDVWYRSLFPETLGSKFEVDQIELLMTEARLLLKLHHPSLLTLIGTANLMEGPAMIMERSAFSIAHLLKDGPIADAPAIRIMTQVASALAYLHDNGICCNGAIEANNIVLISRFLNDPIAKIASLPNGSVVNPETRAGMQAMGKDITDFAILMYRVFSGEELSTKGGQVALPNLTGLNKSNPSIVSLIERAWNGVGLATFELAEKVSAMDEIMNPDVSAPTPSGEVVASPRPRGIEGDQDEDTEEDGSDVL